MPHALLALLRAAARLKTAIRGIPLARTCSVLSPQILRGLPRFGQA
jgi:hypothetical protein